MLAARTVQRCCGGLIPIRALQQQQQRSASSTTTKRSEDLEDEDQQPREIELRYLDGKDNGIAVLGLKRPGSRNALGRRLVDQLADALDRLGRDEQLRCLLVRSLVPGVFCAGADLRERGRMGPEEASSFVDSLRELTCVLEDLPAPTIAALDGSALGGGLELALACDLRTAAAEAQLGLVETRLAIIPGAGGTQRLPRLVGPARAKELVFAARPLSGQEAHGLGLVNRVVPQNKDADAAYQEALGLARQIIPNGPIAVKLAKVAISKGIEVPLKDGFEIEKQCYSQLLNTRDRLEGLSAFVSKRAPVYRGL